MGVRGVPMGTGRSTIPGGGAHQKWVQCPNPAVPSILRHAPGFILTHKLRFLSQLYSRQQRCPSSSYLKKLWHTGPMKNELVHHMFVVHFSQYIDHFHNHKLCAPLFTQKIINTATFFVIKFMNIGHHISELIYLDVIRAWCVSVPLTWGHRTPLAA